jgi:SAM domain (Sterile alpha motif)
LGSGGSRRRKVEVAGLLLGLGQYEQVFDDNNVDEDVLPRLTAEDLIAIGVTSVGHRRKLLEAIAGLKVASSSIPISPSPASGVYAAQRDAERRQLTVMFVDLVGSTALSAKLRSGRLDSKSRCIARARRPSAECRHSEAALVPARRPGSDLEWHP